MIKCVREGQGGMKTQPSKPCFSSPNRFCRSFFYFYVFVLLLPSLVCQKETQTRENHDRGRKITSFGRKGNEREIVQENYVALYLCLVFSFFVKISFSYLNLFFLLPCSLLIVFFILTHIAFFAFSFPFSFIFYIFK